MNSTRDLLHQITVKITTQPANGDPVRGTGILYNTHHDCKYAYLFTVLHNLLGTRSGDQYRYKEKEIQKITIEHFCLKANAFRELEIETKHLIKHEKNDFAILLIDKNIEQNDLVTAIKEIPCYRLKKELNRDVKNLIILGYPGFYEAEGKLWGCRAEESIEKIKYHYCVKVHDTIAGFQALQEIGGLSGSGCFDESAGLIGLVTALGDEKATTDRILVRKLSSSSINKMLLEKDIELEKIRITNPISKLLSKQTGFRIEGIEMDLSRAIGRVKNDMKDDWFQDPLLFEDILTVDFMSEKLKKYSNAKNGYIPESALLFSIPKNGYTSRYSMETNLVDRVVYQMLIDYIIDDFDDIIENSVYSFRYDTRNREDSLFVNSIEQWKKMVHQIKYSLRKRGEEKEDSYLVATDISHFFDNINVTVLIELLHKCNQIYLNYNDGTKIAHYSKVIKILERILSKWSINLNGIPQNREPSCFLANMYLVEIDKFMIAKGYEYYRYSDDIRIVCKHKLEAQHALNDLINALRGLRLNLNSSKTVILNSQKAINEIKKYLPDSNIQLEQINSLLKAKKSRDVQIAVQMVVQLYEGSKRALESSTVQDEEIHSRNLKFCIDRLQRFVRQPFLRKKIDEYIDGVVNYIQAHLLVQPWFSNLYINFLKVLPKEKITPELIQEIGDILMSNDKNIYEWQTYLLWLLLAHHKIECDALKQYAYGLIDHPNPNNKPSTAGACLYLVTIGSPYYISKIKNSIDNHKFNDFFTQRNAIVSIKKFPKIDEDNLIESLKGSHEKLHALKVAYYVKPLPEIKISDLFRDLPNSLVSL